MNNQIIILTITIVLLGVLCNLLTTIFLTYNLKRQFTISSFLKINSLILTLCLFFYIFYIIKERINFNFEILIIGISIYYLLNFVFFNVVNAQICALRVRIIDEIFLNKKISIKNIKKNYSNEQLIRIRIERLTKSGQLRKKGEKLIVNSKLILFVYYLFYFLKLIFYRRGYYY